MVLCCSYHEINTSYIIYTNFGAITTTNMLHTIFVLQNKTVEVLLIFRFFRILFHFFCVVTDPQSDLTVYWFHLCYNICIKLTPHDLYPLILIIIRFPSLDVICHSGASQIIGQIWPVFVLHVYWNFYNVIRDICNLCSRSIKLHIFQKSTTKYI